MDKLLVVDSDKPNLKTVSEGLSKWPRFEVLTAFDSKTAVNLVNNQAISVLITGLHMPDFDGIELLAYMTRAFPATPCIAMLDPGQPRPWFAGSKSFQESLDFIEKPVALETLISSIDTGLRYKSRQTAEKGIMLKHFLPLIEVSKKSCQMEVKSGKKNKGLLYFFRGKLIDARCDNKIGDAAVMEMISWDSVKISIARLPANKREIPIGIPLMDKIGVTFEKKTPVAEATIIPEAIIEETPVPPPDQYLPAPAVIEQLNAALKKYAGVLKTVKGYKALAILTPDGSVLASDSAEFPVDFTQFSSDIANILNQSSSFAIQKGFQKCRGITLHTEKGILILMIADTNQPDSYRFMGLMSPDGNGFFMQVQLEKIIPQILRQ